jgi:hypothetical protein
LHFTSTEPQIPYEKNYSVGNHSLKLALSCEAAVLAKAKARGMNNDGVPFIQHILYRVRSKSCLLPALYLPNSTASNGNDAEGVVDLTNAVDFARSSVDAASSDLDRALGKGIHYSQNISHNRPLVRMVECCSIVFRHQYQYQNSLPGV